MRQKYKFLKSKTVLNSFAIVLAALLSLTGCSPQEDNKIELGGTLVSLPQNWNLSAVDNDNEVVITFDPLDIIDGENILYVQFSCVEAGIKFVVEDPTTTSWKGKVYRSGDYTLYAAAVTRAGAGTPREVTFTVTKDLLLENLGPEVLSVEVTYPIDATHSEKFYKNEFYIEKNREINLTGDIANDAVIVNLDFFKRLSTTKVKFLGESGVYALYWNPVRKNIIIEPMEAIAAPNYYVLTGPGIGYPTTISSDAIKAAYGAGDGRYTTEWDPGKSIRSRVVMFKMETDKYQATICINEGAAFKPFSNTNWGNDAFPAENCTFTGSQIFKPSGNWSPNEKLDKNGYYRITLNASTKAVNVKKVSATGEELEDEIEVPDPDKPIVSDNFDLTSAKVAAIGGEIFLKIFHTLEKDAEYTLKDVLADADVIYNLDFFERKSNDKVKFLGESGDYNLYFSEARKIFILNVNAPDFPNYLTAVGKGFAYPSKVNPSYAGGYPQNCASADILQYVLYRRIDEKTYQATVMLKKGAENLEFKGYHAIGGGLITNDWGNGGEYKYKDCSFTGLSGVFSSGNEGNNWVAGSNLNEALLYRVTITVKEEKKSADVKVQSVDWKGEIQ